MHHVVLERWSRGDSVLHRRDARSKLLVALVFLILLATSHHRVPELSGAYLCALIVGLWGARLPVSGALARAAIVLPFSAVFGLMSWLAGDPARAVALAAKSYVSACAVLVLVASTRMPDLIRAMESLGAPRFLLMVAQFTYRYLFVISEQAQHMRLAAQSRGGFGRGGFRMAAGAMGVLFARSYGRAESIHRAMLSRGFHGHFHLLAAPRFRHSDGLFLILSTIFLGLLRVAAERMG